MNTIDKRQRNMSTSETFWSALCGQSAHRSPFWAACANMKTPSTLKRKIDLFKVSGRVSVEPDNLFKPPHWLAVYLGQNIFPQRYDSRLDARLTVNQSVEALASLRQTLNSAVEHQPTHEDFIASRVSAVDDGLPPAGSFSPT